MLCHSKNSGQPFGAEQKEGALYYCYDVFEEVTRKQNMVTSNNAQGIKRVEKVNNRHKQTRRTSKNSFLLLEDCGKKVPHPWGVWTMYLTYTTITPVVPISTFNRIFNLSFDQPTTTTTNQRKKKETTADDWVALLGLVIVVFNNNFFISLLFIIKL